MANETSDIGSRLLNLLAGQGRIPKYRYILCHPGVEERITEIARGAGVATVSHPNMPASRCLLIESVEELKKVRQSLDTYRAWGVRC